MLKIKFGMPFQYQIKRYVPIGNGMHQKKPWNIGDFSNCILTITQGDKAITLYEDEGNLSVDYQTNTIMITFEEEFGFVSGTVSMHFIFECKKLNRNYSAKRTEKIQIV